MNFLKNWITPFITALILILIFRYLLFDFRIVSDKLMNNSLKKGDLILIQKRARIKRNNIILFDTTQGAYSTPQRLSRCVALAGDTLQIKNSIVYINNKQLDLTTLRKRKILSHYIFKSDSNNIQLFLTKNKIKFNKQLAVTGIYSFYTDKKKLKNINNKNVWKQKQKIIVGHGLYSKKTAPFNNYFYWNIDNFGPLVVPAKGMTIKLNSTNLELYKKILIKETEKNDSLQKSIIHSENKGISNYTFQSDYYFVLNDNRQVHDDSRSFGFIKRDHIFGKVVLKLF